MGGEFTPLYPTNCMIYGVGRSCFRCSVGYFKTSITPSGGIGTNIDKCVAKDTNYGFCASSPSGSESLVPINLKVTNTDYFTIDKFEHCTAKTNGNANNYELV